MHSSMTRTRSLWAVLLALAFAVAAALALSAAPSAYAADDDASTATTWNRLEGEVALDTMAAIVDEGWKDSGTVVLTTQDGYWDALTAAGIAGQRNAPILMTDSKTLSPQAEKLLGKLDPALIIIVGGPAAVSEDVATAAGKAAGGETLVVRAAGENAIGTANDVAAKMKEYTDGTWADTAFIATNDGYWDALAAAPIAYAKNMPIFLADGHASLTDATIKAMNDAGIKNVYLVGGTAALTEDVEKQLKDAGFAVTARLDGETAIETSEAVATEAVKNLGMSVANMGIATNNGYWDALTGAALCGLQGSPLVLVGDETSDSIKTFIAENAAGIKSGYIFGGTSAVSDAVAKAADDALTCVISFVIPNEYASMNLKKPADVTVTSGQSLRDSGLKLPSSADLGADTQYSAQWYTTEDRSGDGVSLKGTVPTSNMTLYLDLASYFTVSVTDADGKVTKKTYTQTEFANLASDSQDAIAGVWGSRMFVAVKYVTIEELVNDAMGIGSWDKLQSENPDLKVTYAAADASNTRTVKELANSTYGNKFANAADPMPAAFGLNVSKSVNFGEGTDYADADKALEGTAAKLEATPNSSNAPQIIWGPVDGGSDYAKSGMSLLSNCLKLEIDLSSSSDASAQSLQAATL